MTGGLAEPCRRREVNQSPQQGFAQVGRRHVGPSEKRRQALAGEVRYRAQIGKLVTHDALERAPNEAGPGARRARRKAAGGRGGDLQAREPERKHAPDLRGTRVNEVEGAPRVDVLDEIDHGGRQPVLGHYRAVRFGREGQVKGQVQRAIVSEADTLDFERWAAGPAPFDLEVFPQQKVSCQNPIEGARKEATGPCTRVSDDARNAQNQVTPRAVGDELLARELGTLVGVAQRLPGLSVVLGERSRVAPHRAAAHVREAGAPEPLD